ncbi:glycoside hydrolase family 43 protein [Stigmatella sp. ncwal1]|uniref:Glycoside hydrolase family 43 protein n=1 Tax=Stigmatella ashevillensis TaxID=2995309 RepID=A0ABT5DHS2_9BACT|nr:glycoside hydrolase family 43 protein [Stigmatella ashevillena]MDC0713168.1 glycoside hydrolase family 43 protein [Stigmatella ashevillena]
MRQEEMESGSVRSGMLALTYEDAGRLARLRKGASRPALLALCAAALVLFTLRPAAATAATNVYTMSAFTNSSESNMYVYQSYNGTHYGLMKGPAYTPPSGLIRDPSILKHTDGLYYVTYTTNWEGNTIGFATSTDRVNWTFRQNVTLPVANLQNTWAPEWFKDSDGSVNIIVSLRTTGTSNFIPHVIKAQNSALTSWSNPVPLSGLGPNYIDTFIVKLGSTYHAFTKNETSKYIEYATSSSLTGPYTFKGTGDWAGWGNWLEGPALIQLDNGAWRIFFDGYTVTKYYYSDSTNTFASWSAKKELPSLTGFVRHLTVLKETGQAGDIRRLQSFNFQTYFVRHYNYQARIEQNVSPAEDSQFRIVPGLADGSAVSFESVNLPGYFLRHSNNVLVLVKNDGTDQFKQDATFRDVAGLANASWTSYQSYNVPGSYIRHYNYTLRIEPITTSVAQSDATFREITP